MPFLFYLLSLWSLVYHYNMQTVFRVMLSMYRLSLVGFLFLPSSQRLGLGQGLWGGVPLGVRGNLHERGGWVMVALGFQLFQVAFK